jgi:hypothetical protein
MKRTKDRRISKVLAAVSVFLILGFVVTSAGWADSLCEKALARCLVDAVVATILSGPETGGAYVLGCLNGYTWCLMYYLEFEEKI